jgi:hypothetical protein
LHERRTEDPAVAVMERLKGYAQAAVKQRQDQMEAEFAGRPRASGSGWMR